MALGVSSFLGDLLKSRGPEIPLWFIRLFQLFNMMALLSFREIILALFLLRVFDLLLRVLN